MTKVSIIRNGEIIEVDEETVRPVLPVKERLAAEAYSNILNAPLLGFSGPTAKELFNGNR